MFITRPFSEWPLQDSLLAIDSSGLSDGDDVKAAGGYRRGVFVRAPRGSSIDIGLFHDDQRRSVATVEMWVNAGEKVGGSRITSSLLAPRHAVGRRGGGWICY